MTDSKDIDYFNFLFRWVDHQQTVCWCYTLIGECVNVIAEIYKKMWHKLCHPEEITHDDVINFENEIDDFISKYSQHLTSSSLSEYRKHKNLFHGKLWDISSWDRDETDGV